VVFHLHKVVESITFSVEIEWAFL